MRCPFFVDYTRECATNIKLVQEVSTFQFCTTQDYELCPFYRVAKNIGEVCEYIPTCPIFAGLSIKNFEKFKAVTQCFCLSENKVSCARYKLRASGIMPAKNVMPDGSIFS